MGFQKAKAINSQYFLHIFSQDAAAHLVLIVPRIFERYILYEFICCIYTKSYPSRFHYAAQRGVIFCLSFLFFFWCRLPFSTSYINSTTDSVGCGLHLGSLLQLSVYHGVKETFS